MEKKLKKLTGKYCKLVINTPDTTKAEVITGKLEKVDYHDGFLYIETSQGPACFRLDSVIAAKRIRRMLPVDQ